jgi:transcriptional regulator with XRE-family HTH domain
MKVPNKEHRLLDTVMREYKLQTDADLARFLGVNYSAISKIRNGHLVPSSEYILRVHDLTGWDIKLIKGLI